MIGRLHQDFKEIKSVFQDKKTEKLLLENQLKELGERKVLTLNKIEGLEKARIILQIVATNTQKTLEFHISGLGTLALKSVDESWPEYIARFGIKRNKPECEILFKENDVEQKPLESSGGGCKDIGSFAGLLSYWNLNRSASIFILDEPFRNVSPDLQHKVSKTVKRISEELEIQIIMVSHAEKINMSADKTLFVRKENGESIVEEVI